MPPRFPINCVTTMILTSLFIIPFVISFGKLAICWLSTSGFLIWDGVRMPWLPMIRFYELLDGRWYGRGSI